MVCVGGASEDAFFWACVRCLANELLKQGPSEWKEGVQEDGVISWKGLIKGKSFQASLQLWLWASDSLSGAPQPLRQITTHTPPPDGHTLKMKVSERVTWSDAAEEPHLAPQRTF